MDEYHVGLLAGAWLGYLVSWLIHHDHAKCLERARQRRLARGEFIVPDEQLWKR